jgi:hypothetical protein
MYVTLNNYAAANWPLLVVRSSDGGVSWSTPVTLTASSTLIRDVNVTGGPDGTVYVAALDEGGGGTNPRQNWVYRSTNGGATWPGFTLGAPFLGSGDFTNGWFRYVNPIWKDRGWGNSGLAWAARSTTSIRSARRRTRETLTTCARPIRAPPGRRRFD